MKMMLVSEDESHYRYFDSQGWKFVKSLVQADVVQFMGGPDISPSLYSQATHKKTKVSDVLRDLRETVIARKAILHGTPVAGICRGGQLLNVINGGYLVQHVGGHTATHPAWVEEANEMIDVTSTHHQMMMPGPSADITITAWEVWAGEIMSANGQPCIISFEGDIGNPEAIVYKKTNSLCFQPHPEYDKSGELYEVYCGQLCHILK